MRRFQFLAQSDNSELNLSPMLDVVFIMLIFFVVVATFVKETGLPVSLPNTGEQGPDVEAINVIVHPGATFEINGRRMSANSVRPYVRALHGEFPDASFGVLLATGSVVRDAAVAIEAGRSIGLDVVPIMPTE